MTPCRLYSDARLKVAVGKIVAGVKDFEVGTRFQIFEYF